MAARQRQVGGGDRDGPRRSGRLPSRMGVARLLPHTPGSRGSTLRAPVRRSGSRWWAQILMRCCQPAESRASQEHSGLRPIPARPSDTSATRYWKAAGRRA